MKIKSCLLALTLLLTSACAPGLGTRLRVPVIPDKDAQLAANMLGNLNLRVHVGRFNDVRQPVTIGEINGRLLDAEGNVGDAVQQGFERLLTLAGVRLALFDAPVIQGDVNNWYVTVHTGFPTSKVTATATIEVSVLDRRSSIIYKASYSGETTEENPFLSQSKIQTVLGTAMSYAIREALNDRRLIEKLAGA